MNPLNRRELLATLSAFATLAALPESPASAQAVAGPPAEPVLATQKAYPFDQLPVAHNANGESRAVVHGVLPTGEAVELHETTLLPGHMPHPPHKHRHSEFMLIREGNVEFDNDGTPQRVGPGGVCFAASNIMHGLKNIGDTNANYFVLAIGRETPATPV